VIVNLADDFSGLCKEEQTSGPLRREATGVRATGFNGRSAASATSFQPRDRHIEDSQPIPFLNQTGRVSWPLITFAPFRVSALPWPTSRVSGEDELANSMLVIGRTHDEQVFEMFGCDPSEGDRLIVFVEPRRTKVAKARSVVVPRRSFDQSDISQGRGIVSHCLRTKNLEDWVS
jgi:hypothetical protein